MAENTPWRWFWKLCQSHNRWYQYLTQGEKTMLSWRHNFLNKMSKQQEGFLILGFLGFCLFLFVLFFLNYVWSFNGLQRTRYSFHIALPLKVPHTNYLSSYFIPKHAVLQKTINCSPSCTHYTWHTTKVHSELSEYDTQCSIDRECYGFASRTVVSGISHWALSTKYCYRNCRISR